MSWLTKLGSSIGHAFVTVARVVTSPAATAIEKSIPLVGTFVALVNPTLAALVSKGSGIVNGVEALITTAQSGAAKKQTAIQIAKAEIPGMEELIAQFGVKVNLPDAELGAFLDSIVAMYNAGHALVQAIEAHNAPAAPPAA